MDAFFSINLNWGMMFLIQTTTGIFSNCFLFHLYNFPLFTEQVLRPTNLIINQLVVSNSLVFISKGIPQTVASFGLTFVLGDTGCKLILCLYRVARGVSLSTTSIFSAFQATKLHSKTSGWLSLRIRSSKCIGICCFLCWILQLMLNIHVIKIARMPKNTKNLSTTGIYTYCFISMTDTLNFFLPGVILLLSDIVYLFLMAWASVSMVHVLHKHKRRVQHIHSHSLSVRPSHEDRATWTILILVTMFLSFYSLSFILSILISQTVIPSHWLLNTSVLISLAFPTLSPFVFKLSNSCAFQFCFISCTYKNCPSMVSGF